MTITQSGDNFYVDDTSTGQQVYSTTNPDDAAKFTADAKHGRQHIARINPDVDWEF